jgi:hypothetical protein
MTGIFKAYAKILFCVMHHICNLAQEFNGLVSKQDWLFPQPVLLLYRQFYEKKNHLQNIDIQYFKSKLV